MSFYDVAESPLLYGLVIIAILFVLGFAGIFLKRSWSRALEIGITKDDLHNVVKSSLSFSLVPSIAIVIGFFSLAAMLGVPWPWYRLSVIGSVTYEIMAANMALAASGVDLATASAENFALIMYVMSICILGGLVAAIFFAKKIQTGAIKMKNKDVRWGSVGTSSFLLSIMVVFMVPMILAGGVSLLTWLTSACVAIVLAIIIKKFNVHWLSNFVLALSLLISMASSVLWTNLLV